VALQKYQMMVQYIQTIHVTKNFMGPIISYGSLQ
jgi:hypothetical protein